MITDRNGRLCEWRDLSQRSRAEAENKAAESVGEKASVRGKYWRPDLNRSEWNLLNRRLEEEIESSGQYLDESTKWLYADEKGVQVFALYGIGDGTEATPLYAVGGEKALKAHEFLTSKMEVLDNEAERNRENVGRWISGVRGDEKYDRYDTHALGRTGTVTNGTDQLHGGTPNGDSERIAGKGNRNGEVKFSLWDPVEQTRDLVAVHNLTEQNLRDAFYLGGLPMPSIAIVKAALEKLPVYRGTVYRHYDFDSFGGYEAMADFLSQFVKGEKTNLGGYLSASTVPNESRTNGEYTVDMVIQSETGRSLNGFGRNTENEVLLPRTVRLAVDSMELISPHKIRMIAREVITDETGATADSALSGMRNVRESVQRGENLRQVSGRDSGEIQTESGRTAGRDGNTGLPGLREGEESVSLGGSGVGVNDRSANRAAEGRLKFSVRDSAGRELTAAQQVLSRH